MANFYDFSMPAGGKQQKAKKIYFATLSGYLIIGARKKKSQGKAQKNHRDGKSPRQENTGVKWKSFKLTTKNGNLPEGRLPKKTYATVMDLLRVHQQE